MQLRIPFQQLKSPLHLCSSVPLIDRASRCVAILEDHLQRLSPQIDTMHGFDNIPPPPLRAPPLLLGETELRDALPTAGVAERGGSREAAVKERAPALVRC